jgi:hypothetical protein
MKKFIALTLGTLAISVAAQAQLTVYDPQVHSQLVISTAQEVAKFVEMINNQVRQIGLLADQVNTLRHYVDLFGDPASFAPASITSLIDDLRKTELGKTLTDLEAAADATAAMVYTRAGLFPTVGTTFATPGGASVARRKEPYRPIAAVQKTTENYLEVSKDATTRRIALKEEISRTTDSLKIATTDAEVQKLTGVLVGLSAALESTDQELSQATASSVIQDIANRADAQRQIEAKQEQQHAEFTEAVDKYGKTFRLLNAPVKFPTR